MSKRTVSGIALTLLLIGMLTLAFNIQTVKASGTIYIRADGSIDPPTANITTADNVTYYFTDNNYDEIVIERSNIVIDGNEYTLQGLGAGNGFDIKSDNVTIRKTNIKSFHNGIYISSTKKDNMISKCNIFNNTYGIYTFTLSTDNDVSQNLIVNNSWGVYFVKSFNGTVSGNSIVNNTYGVYLHQDSSNNLVSGNNITNSYMGIYLVSNDFNTVSQNLIVDNFRGIVLSTYCSNSVVSNNNISRNQEFGVDIYQSCSNNTISGNNITENNVSGIDLSGYNHTVSGNNLINNSHGIWLRQSFNSTVFGNDILDNMLYGIHVYESSNNTIYHNNLVGNPQQAKMQLPTRFNIWDDGYPSGGNYWSDYNGTDFYSGPYQNETGSDGIGDNPYVIDANNIDSYPLMYPYGSVRNFDTSLTYLTIQSAINAPETLDGHSVFVEAGTYYENVVVGKSIQLIGEDPATTIIDGSGTGYVIDVTTDNVNITGFTIQYGEIGIRLWYTNHDTISNNIILNHTTGIDLAWSDYNLIVNCSLTNCTSAGIALWTTSAHNTYENCNASYCFRGFHVGWGHYNLVKNCKAWNCTQWGIVLDSCWYARVENCDVWFNDAGIVIYSFGTARYNTITDCNAYLNGIGINAYDPNSPGGYNKIYHNMLVNNTQYQARDGQYYPNEWDDGYPSGGNYWSDYKERYPNATEIDNSGIWDTQYEIAENNTDNYPLIHPYGSIRNLHTNLTYLTIQKAVDATETLDGHTIQVDAGTYHENVNVNKRLKILGAGASISIVNASDPSKHAFHVISTDNVSISGFTIAGALGNGNGGVFLNSGNNHNISGNVISSNYYGVYVNGYLSNNNTITHNQFIQNGYGINLHGSRHQVISDNVVRNSWHGISLWSSQHNYIIENAISSNHVSGIRLDSSSNNIIYHNNLINNTKQVDILTSGCTNNWDNGYPCGGNYWSDYVGEDFFSGPDQNITRSDGIGDTPHIIDENNTDWYPLMGPLGPLTMVGENITVFPADDACLIFENVAAEGLTTVNETETGPEPPSGFMVDQYYRIETSANYSGKIAIRIIYDDSNMTQEQEENLQLMQWDEMTQEWMDITTYIDTENNVIIGETSHLSMFGVTRALEIVNYITITEVTPSKTIVGEGYSVTINVTIANLGDMLQTFNVTVYANANAIDSKNVTLASGNYTTITFSWNTTSFAKGNYTISAYATPVQGETATADNTLVADEEVCVTIPGDVDGDFDVDLFDAVKLLYRYGVKAGTPDYDPNLDINDNGQIYLYDAVILLTHYGQKYP